MILGHDQLSGDFNAFLVRLHDSENVLRLAKEKTPTAITELSEIIAEALDSNLSAQESEMAAEILVDLAKRMQSGLRKNLALRLSSLNKLPLRLALFFANDHISVAHDFLRRTPSLSDTDLYYIIQGQGSEHWEAIARRKNLGADIMALLAEKDDYATNKALLENMEIALTEKTQDLLVTFVRRNSDLIKNFVARPEAMPELVKDLYVEASQALRDVILEYASIDSQMLDQQIEDIAKDFESTTYGDVTVTKEMQHLAKRMKDQKTLTFDAVLTTLKNNQLGTFMAMLSAYANISMAAVYKIIEEDAGKALAVFAKAYDISRSDMVALFTYTRKYMTIEEEQKKDGIYTAIKYYNNIDKEDAVIVLERFSKTN